MSSELIMLILTVSAHLWINQLGGRAAPRALVLRARPPVRQACPATVPHMSKINQVLSKGMYSAMKNRQITIQLFN